MLRQRGSVPGAHLFTYEDEHQAPRGAPTHKPTKQQVRYVVNFEEDDDSDDADMDEESEDDDDPAGMEPENVAAAAPLPPPPPPAPVAAPVAQAGAIRVVQDLFKAGAEYGSGNTPFHTVNKKGKPITEEAKEKLWERHLWKEVPPGDAAVIAREPLYDLPPAPTLPLRSDDTPLGHFRLRFVPAIIAKIVAYTNQYPEWSNQEKLTVEEFEAVLGGHLALGIDGAPQLHLNWDSSGRYRRPVVADRFARNRYSFVLANFHTHALMNEDEKAAARANDALWHVREILELMRQALGDSYVPGGRLALDENSTPSRAHSGIQVYNPQKPVKRAIKTFVLVDTETQCILNFIVFCGKSTLTWDKAPQDALPAPVVGGAAVAADRHDESDHEDGEDSEEVRL